MRFLITIHNPLRWVIIAVALVALVKSALGYRQKNDYDGMARGLMSGFSGLMDLQALIGIVLLIARGFTPGNVAHGLIMLTAVVVGHLPARWKEQPAATRYQRNIYVIIGVLALIGVGVAALPGGWSR